MTLLSSLRRNLIVCLGALAALPAAANVIGSDFQNFNTTTNGIDFVTVQSAQTLAPGVFNTGICFNYTTNSLPEFKDGEPRTESSGGIRNSAVFADLNFGLGLTKRWDIGISFPSILNQDVKEEDASRIEYDTNGFNEVRLNTKFRLLGNRDHALAVVLTVNQNLVEANPYAGEGAGPIFNLEFAGHTTAGPVRMGLNAGYRKKTPGDAIEEVTVEPFNDQWNASAAFSYLISAIDTKMILEFFGSGAVDPGKTDSEVFQKTGEALLGVKFDLTTALAFHAGVSTGVIESPVAPDIRVYTGINWNAGPFWGKKVKVKKRKKRPKDAPPPVEPEPIATFVFENIKFVFDSSKQVLGGARAELQELADYLDALPSWSRLVIEGHTDSVGDVDYNEELSLRRARAVRNHLVSNFNVPADKIEVVGYGEAQPIADNENYQGRQLNRRVEVKIFIDE